MGEYIEEPLTDEILDKHKAYIQSWAKEIRNNKNFLFKAIKEAEKAADYMIENAQLYQYKKDNIINIGSCDKENNNTFTEKCQEQEVISFSKDDEELEF
ncbi:Antirestriction protein [[Eubacterium] infirmum]|nr:Antirestriction protein [[Eubacterium] infirmum]STO01554.1 Antirestriction protein [[Eubacterium] infirmum]